MEGKEGKKEKFEQAKMKEGKKNDIRKAVVGEGRRKWRKGGKVGR